MIVFKQDMRNNVEESWMMTLTFSAAFELFIRKEKSWKIVQWDMKWWREFDGDDDGEFCCCFEVFIREEKGSDLLSFIKIAWQH